MKSLIGRIPVIILICCPVYTQIQINLQNDFGYTIVNVSEAMEIPEYSYTTREGLVDWDQFNYRGFVQLFFSSFENLYPTIISVL